MVQNPRSPIKCQDFLVMQTLDLHLVGLCGLPMGWDLLVFLLLNRVLFKKRKRDRWEFNSAQLINHIYSSTYAGSVNTELSCVIVLFKIGQLFLPSAKRWIVTVCSITPLLKCVLQYQYKNADMWNLQLNIYCLSLITLRQFAFPYFSKGVQVIIVTDLRMYNIITFYVP